MNVTIKPVQITWNDWQDKTKIWAASGQLPDIFIGDFNRSIYNSWAEQGVIKALPQDLSKYPHIKEVMSLPSVQPWLIDGKFYKFPRMTFSSEKGWANNRNIIYRKDWAKEAGYDGSPANFEDFVKMTKDVMKKHPECVGLSTTNSGFILTLMLGIFPEAASADNWVQENGKWMPVFASSRFAQGLKQFRTLYKDGILDKDFAIEKDRDGVVKFFSGQAFSYVGDSADWKNYGSTFKRMNPDVSARDAVGYIDIWPAEDGKKYYFITTPYWSETYFRNSMSDEKFRKALELLDYMYSDEYMLQYQDGIKNVDYKVENGKYISLLEKDKSLTTKYPVTAKLGTLSGWGGWIVQSGRLVVNTDPDQAYIDQMDLAAVKQKQAEREPMPVNFDITLMSIPEKDKITSVLNQSFWSDLVKVIISDEDPVKMWDTILTGYNQKGLSDAIAAVTAEAAKEGIK
ncbi:MAG: extracellular solute-binding protein [Treponema sp.]